MARKKIVCVHGPSRSESWVGEIVREDVLEGYFSVLLIRKASGEEDFVCDYETREATEEEEVTYWFQVLRDS